MGDERGQTKWSDLKLGDVLVGKEDVTDRVYLVTGVQDKPFPFRVDGTRLELLELTRGERLDLAGDDMLTDAFEVLRSAGNLVEDMRDRC